MNHKDVKYYAEGLSAGLRYGRQGDYGRLFNEAIRHAGMLITPEAAERIGFYEGLDRGVRDTLGPGGASNLAKMLIAAALADPLNPDNSRRADMLYQDAVENGVPSHEIIASCGAAIVSMHPKVLRA